MGTDRASPFGEHMDCLEQWRGDRRFYCYLEEQPTFLVPEERSLARDRPGVIRVSEHFWAPWMGPPPVEVRDCASFRRSFAPHDSIAWVGDPDTRALWPYWLGSHYRAIVRRLRMGAPC